MTDAEWQQLVEMRECIMTSGMQSFDPAYMDSFAQLLAKSLQGKGNAISHEEPNT
jgi:hypothetical protein